MRTTKEMDGIESDDRERGRKEQCGDNKYEERRLRGGRKNNRKHDIQEGDRGERDSRELGCDNRTREEINACDMRRDDGKKGSESRCVETDVNNRDDDRTKTGRKERNNRESGRGEVNDQVDAKRRSYSEAMIEGALRTERVFMGDSILRKTDKTLSKEEYIAICLPGARIEHVG